VRKKKWCPEEKKVRIKAHLKGGWYGEGSMQGKIERTGTATSKRRGPSLNKKVVGM